MKLSARFFAIALSVSLLWSGTAAAAAIFKDITPIDKNAVAINTLTRLAIIQGDSNGNFNPLSALKRSEASAIITRMMTDGFQAIDEFKGTTNFADVSKTFWGEPFISYCTHMGIVMGDRSGAFRPNDTVTEAEFVAMITRVLGYDTTSTPLLFPMENIQVAEKLGILDGIKIDIHTPATREKVAKIVYNALFTDAPRYALTSPDGSQIAKTTAEAVFGLRRVTAMLVATSYASSDGFERCDENYIKLASLPQSLEQQGEASQPLQPDADDKADDDKADDGKAIESETVADKSDASVTASEEDSKSEVEQATPPSGTADLNGTGTYYFSSTIAADPGTKVEIWFYNIDQSQDVVIDSRSYSTLTEKDIVLAVLPLA